MDAGGFWGCRSSPALSVFWLRCSCGPCQSAETYRMNFGEGLTLPDLFFRYSLLEGARCAQFVCV